LQNQSDYSQNIFSKKDKIIEAYEKGAEKNGWGYVETVLKKCLGDRFYGNIRKQIKSLSPSQSKALLEMGNSPTESYFLYGKYGTGKTHIAALLYEVLAYWKLARGYVWIPEVELKEDFRKATVEDGYFPKISVARINRGSIKSLFIDDMGKVKPSDFYRQELYGIIDTIYRQNRQLVITSNYSLAQLSHPKELGVGICRRIQDVCKENIIQFEAIKNIETPKETR